MKTFKNIITLNKNSRGCYILDIIKGCGICLKNNPNGCYDDCYAKKIASRYGYNFGITINRGFYKDDSQLYMFNMHDERHQDSIIHAIKKINMPFVRIGEMGDPSQDWEHTINICNIISSAKKPIVIITKHWKQIPDNLISDIEKLNIYIHTSISAMDSENEIDYRLSQYKKLKNHCQSILRVVSCDFNVDNDYGKWKSRVQKKLFDNEKVIDTVFRPDKNNKLVVQKIINTKKIKFLKSNVIASVYNKNTFMGHCGDCPEMCGIGGLNENNRLPKTNESEIDSWRQMALS